MNWLLYRGLPRALGALGITGWVIRIPMGPRFTESYQLEHMDTFHGWHWRSFWLRADRLPHTLRAAPSDWHVQYQVRDVPIKGHGVWESEVI